MAERDPHDDMEYATGPTTIHVKNTYTVGSSVCLEDPLPVVSCGPFQPGTLEGFYPATFDTSGWSGATREVRVWGTHMFGGICDPVSCSFSMTVCNDRNDDQVCATNSGDQAVTVLSDEAFINPGNCDETSKDSKDCGDRTDAEAVVCLAADASGGFDDFQVHFGAWSSEPLFTSTNGGLGAVVDRYEVYVEYGDFGCAATPSTETVLIDPLGRRL